MSTPAPPNRRTVVLVGLMGAGKTTVGRRLAARLGVPFVDADAEIETAAGCSIAETFARHGEAEFRDGERRVIVRLLDSPPHVLATGGGALTSGTSPSRCWRSNCNCGSPNWRATAAKSAAGKGDVRKHSR